MPAEPRGEPGQLRHGRVRRVHARRLHPRRATMRRVRLPPEFPPEGGGPRKGRRPDEGLRRAELCGGGVGREEAGPDQILGRAKGEDAAVRREDRMADTAQRGG